MSQVFVSTGDSLKAFLRIAGSPAANAPEADLDEICALVPKFNKDHPQLEPFELTKLLSDCRVVRRVKSAAEPPQSEIERIRARAQNECSSSLNKTQGVVISFGLLNSSATDPRVL